MPTVTVLAVATDRRKTPPRSFQLGDPTWEMLGAGARELGMSRAAVVAALCEWWVRCPGAKLPERPPRKVT